ncbi:hypothetical protein AMTRI_Chr05g60400 [Amborella trichopoda]
MVLFYLSIVVTCLHIQLSGWVDGLKGRWFMFFGKTGFHFDLKTSFNSFNCGGMD